MLTILMKQKQHHDMKHLNQWKGQSGNGSTLCCLTQHVFSTISEWRAAFRTLLKHVPLLETQALSRTQPVSDVAEMKCRGRTVG